MYRNLFTPFKKAIGIILIILGVFGAFIPIPLVPFFLLVIIGLGLIGVKPESINKLRLWIDKLGKKFLNKNK